MSGAQEPKGTRSSFVLILFSNCALTISTVAKAPTSHWKPFTTENRPTWVLPNPFETYSLGEYNQDEQGPRSLTVFELTKYELSWALRSKPDQQPKAANPHICRKWCQEALEQAAVEVTASEDSPELRLTEKMIDYVLVELDGYAKIADNEWNRARLLRGNMVFGQADCEDLLERPKVIFSRG
ncbi:hypothetical protein DFH08DRAFT_905412 [Mycena albidolilacea]|uniref:Uncharacterized protein n=1 Tax=Mycena albidolilacea TaxID=1033008 RepID=A0AAD7E7X4_9AGAR|nr:hypothetical protein DFH08DRAFT_905412 [Mycena albidolilacea]